MERRRWASGARFLALMALALLSHPGDARGFPVPTSAAGTGVFLGSVALGRGTFFIAPGLQWITGGGRVLLEVSVQLPLSQNLWGSQPEADYDLLFGLRFAY